MAACSNVFSQSKVFCSVTCNIFAKKFILCGQNVVLFCCKIYALVSFYAVCFSKDTISVQLTCKYVRPGTKLAFYATLYVFKLYFYLNFPVILLCKTFKQSWKISKWCQKWHLSHSIWLCSYQVHVLLVYVNVSWAEQSRWDLPKWYQLQFKGHLS